MPDIVHDFSVKATRADVFKAVSTPAGLDSWWTKRSSGEPKQNAAYELWFGPEYDWRAIVSRYVPDTEFELQLTAAQEDWQGTKVGFRLDEKDGYTHVRFHHRGWPQENDHYRGSCFCWAMYLRLLKRYIESGAVVPYEKRDEA